MKCVFLDYGSGQCSYPTSGTWKTPTPRINSIIVKIFYMPIRCASANENLQKREQSSVHHQVVAYSTIARVERSGR